MIKTKWLYSFPIVLTAIGVVIHLFGVLSLFQRDVPWLVHAIMLSIDVLVVAGLLRKSRWGYWLAVVLYVEQSLFQPYWCFQIYAQGGGILQLIVVSSVCVASLVILAFNRGLFIAS